MDSEIHGSVVEGSLSAFRDLVEKKGIKALKRKDGDERTCLHVAAEEGKLDIIKYIYETFDDDEFIFAPDCDLRTPLHWAAWKGHVETVLFLVQYENVDVRTRTGFTPLHYATVQGNEAMVKVLLEAGADFTLQDQNQQMPIDCARSFNREKIVQILEDHREKEEKEALENPSKFELKQKRKARRKEVNLSNKATCEQGKYATKRFSLASFLSTTASFNVTATVSNLAFVSVGFFAVGLSLTLGVSLGVLTYKSLTKQISRE
mmetsp:Transcript_13863/g.16816  ORF Transcript_13863/g.16816 Transcript_13863/m.16816 type:complete len:262 (+) Transcript_13863:117-902(+)